MEDTLRFIEKILGKCDVNTLNIKSLQPNTILRLYFPIDRHKFRFYKYIPSSCKLIKIMFDQKHNEWCSHELTYMREYQMENFVSFLKHHDGREGVQILHHTEFCEMVDHYHNPTVVYLQLQRNFQTFLNLQIIFHPLTCFHCRSFSTMSMLPASIFQQVVEYLVPPGARSQEKEIQASIEKILNSN